MHFAAGRAARIVLPAIAMLVAGCGTDDDVDRGEARRIGVVASEFVRALANADGAGLEHTLEGSCRSAVPALAAVATSMGITDKRIEIASVDVSWIRGDAAEAVIRLNGDATGGPNVQSPPTTLRFVSEGGEWLIDCDQL